MAYVRQGPLGSVPLGQTPVVRSRVCAAADRASTAHDAASATLLKLLREPVTADQAALQARRATALRRLFDGLDTPAARRLGGRLNDRGDPLAQFFDCELSTPLRADLRARLTRPPDPPPAPVTVRPAPPAPAPAPTPLPPWPPVGPWQHIRPPAVPPGMPWPPPVSPPGPWIPTPPYAPPWIDVGDLLHRARGVLALATRAGVTGLAVVGLAAAVGAVGRLVPLIYGPGVSGHLVFDAVAGKLSLRLLASGAAVHQGVLQSRARALMQPEWGQLEQQLRELVRYEAQAREQTRNARGQFQQKQQGDEPPGSSFEDEVCGRVARRFRYSAHRVHVRRYGTGGGFPGAPVRGPVLVDPRVVVDCVGSGRSDRGLRLFEAKASGPGDLTNPGLTGGQRIVYGELPRYGGRIVVDAGPFAQGTLLPRGTVVTVVTPANIDLVLPEP
ncbi:hypothetical protein [Streptomyces sp. NBC_01236]|uniref:hypothetical protein n=1 Tax=Streptomyces sp. NBC_01236 TaxID=2903789 RepID=UPI002E150E0B|nr:hypothetical protein OG324_42855 [Streptomyces sp. NBC_01236]